MKLKILLILVVTYTFLSCNSDSHTEKINVFNGTYEATETGNISQIGVWVFSSDEISILISDNLENPYANLKLIAVQKYYIKDDIIYSCLCTTDDCLDKDKNFEKLWKIESVNQTNNKRTITLTNIFDSSFKVKLEKDKSIGLDVKDWK